MSLSSEFTFEGIAICIITGNLEKRISIRDTTISTDIIMHRCHYTFHEAILHYANSFRLHDVCGLWQNFFSNCCFTETSHYDR